MIHIYEHMTYEYILQRMLTKVLEKNPNIDTREGSIIFNALAPAAVELQNMYIQLDVILNETFADTATRKYLIKRVSERGIIPYPATYGILQGEFNMDIPIGSRFALDNLRYKATERMSYGVYKMQCETIGTIGNENFGTLIPLQYIDGLTKSRLTELLIPGEEDEDTEHIRQRYFDSLNAEAFGGNIKDYKEKVMAIAGVGGVKVYPVWNGGGTVKLVIIASDYSVPTKVLIDDVQTQIDPVQNQGNGVGIAPIGHVVTVEGVRVVTVNIATTLALKNEWTWKDVEPYAQNAIDEYFLELSETWESEENLIVRISQIESRLLNLSWVVDIGNTTINGVAQNLVLDVNEIPIRGVISG